MDQCSTKHVNSCSGGASSFRQAYLHSSLLQFLHLGVSDHGLDHLSGDYLRRHTLGHDSPAYFIENNVGQPAVCLYRFWMRMPSAMGLPTLDRTCSALLHPLAMCTQKNVREKAFSVVRVQSQIKDISTRARKEMESLLGSKVFLRMTVLVDDQWTKRAASLRKYGIQAGDSA